MSIAPTQLDYRLAAIKQAWFAAPVGSPEREQLHRQAQELRAAGASEAVANFLVTGTTTGEGLQYAQGYMGPGWAPPTIPAPPLRPPVAPPATPAPNLARNATQLDQQLAVVKARWFAAPEGSPERTQLHQEATALRAQGASEAIANQLVTGSPEGRGLQYARGYMGPEWTPTTPTAAPTPPAAAPTRPPVAEMPLPTITQPPPPRVDLTALRTVGLHQPTTIPAFTPPPTRELREAIAAMTPPTAPVATTPATFTPAALQQAIAAQGQGVAPAPMPARLATPEQFGQWVDQTQTMLRPHLEAQRQAATMAFNRAMRDLDDRWARQGMLASGVAPAQQHQAAQEFAIQQGLLEAQQLQQAIDTAIQAGQLSLTEGQAIWNQAMAGAQFGQQQALNQAELLQRALGAQDQQRLAEQGLDLDTQRLRLAQQQARVAALQDVTGLEAQQAQFGAQLGLETQQLELQRQQALADHLARVMGMEVQQGQWGAEHGFAQERAILERAIAHEGLAADERRAAEEARARLAQLELQTAAVTGVYRGRPTLEADQLRAAQERQAWQAEMDAWRAELEMDNVEFDRWLKTQGQALDRARVALDRDQQAYLREKGRTEAQGQAATQGYLARLAANTWLPVVRDQQGKMVRDAQGSVMVKGPNYALPLVTIQDAFRFITDYTDLMIEDGADVRQIWQALRHRWPDFYRGGGGFTAAQLAEDPRLKELIERMEPGK